MRTECVERPDEYQMLRLSHEHTPYGYLAFCAHKTRATHQYDDTNREVQQCERWRTPYRPFGSALHCRALTFAHPTLSKIVVIRSIQMHPPFIFTNHKVGPDPYYNVGIKTVRRGAPARLDMSVMTTGWPPIALNVPAVTLPLSPSGQPLITGLRLQVVPQPRNELREYVGRWLIRMGQRMILANRPG